MKRVLSLLLSVLMVAFLALPAAAETTDETEAHVHQLINCRSIQNQYGSFHVGTCADCGQSVREEHNFVEGTCTACGCMDHDHKVTYKPESNMDGDFHAGTCTECGTWVRADHTYDEKNICTVCGYEKHEHDVSEYHSYVNSAGDTYHAGICSVCQKGIPFSHNMDGDTCTVCGYVDHDHTWQYTTRNENGHRAACEECGALAEFEGHTFQDGICTVCGYQKHEHQINEYRQFVTPYGDSHGGTCTTCGEWVNEDHTYENGKCTACGFEEHTHQVASYLPDENADGPYHAGICSVCRLSVPAFHTGDPCTVCGYEVHEHQITRYGADEYRHWGICSECGLSVEYGEHTFQDGICTVCGYKDHVHKLKGYMSMQNLHGSFHLGFCAECGQWINEDHNFVNGVCTACGCMDHPHDVKFEPESSLDGDTHDGTCTECGTWVRAAHTYGENGVCTACGYTQHEHQIAYTLAYKSLHESLCTECGLTVSGRHTMNNGACTVCGYMEHDHTFGEYTVINNGYHRARCQTCGMIDNDPHDFAGDVCSKCGFTVHGHDAASYDRPYEDGHCGRCALCGLLILQDHTMADGVCTVCGYRDHAHTLKYTAEGDMHYAVCTECGMLTHREYHPLHGSCSVCHNRVCSHTWDAGKVIRPATYAQEGEMQYRCSDCGIYKTEPLARLLRCCAHACTVCGGCTLPASDASCRYDRCGCEQPQAPSSTPVKARLEAAVTGLTLSAEKVEPAQGSPYARFITQAAGSYRVKSVYDISLLFRGSRYDLRQGESVAVTLTVGEENAKRVAAGQLFLLHAAEGGSVLYGPGGRTVTADVQNGTITFTTESFSPFLLVENEQTAGTACLQVGSAAVIKGREVTIPVTVTGNPGFAAMTFSVDYDKTRLELLGCEMDLEGFNATVSKENGRIVFVRASNYTEDGVILTLRFKVPQEAQDGLAEIALTVQEALSADETAVSFGTSSGSVRVVTRIPGDTTDDGIVDLKDILRLKKYLAGKDVVINLTNADMNENGEVQLDDLLLLMEQYAAGR